MPISLKNLNPSTRFNYDEDGEEWVELRLVSGDKMEEFRKTIGMKPKTKYIVNTISKKMESVSDLDIPEEKITQFNDLCLDYQIANWNLVEPDGNAIPCNLGNKKLLMNGEPSFSAWVSAHLTNLQGKIDEIGGQILKN
jgi:hypothetical protein